jgi:hypothetical protein
VLEDGDDYYTSEANTGMIRGLKGKTEGNHEETMSGPRDKLLTVLTKRRR